MSILRESHIDTGAVVFDLGAFSGTQTVFFSRAVGPTGRVFAFEPDPRNRAALETNLAHHGVTNVTVVPAGAWSFNGQLKFHSDGSMHASFVAWDFTDATQVNVPVCRLMDYAVEQKLTRVDYVKMDIEGAELQVVEDLGEFLKVYSPRLIIEPHVINNRDLLPPLKGQLQAFGYVCEMIDQPGSGTQLLLAYPPSKVDRDAVSVVSQSRLGGDA
jgi:FkbM family methyltransferase